jgi:uncharacterized protein (TIGR02145 family)
MVDIRGFNGGLNMDAGLELLPSGDYNYAYNVENTAEGITNMLGNRLLEGAPPATAGTEWICGSFFDKVRQRIIYFTNNIQGYHRIISVNVTTGEHIVLFEDVLTAAPEIVQVTLPKEVNITTQKIYIFGDNLLLNVGDTFTIAGSDSNDGTFTVVTHSYTTDPLFPNVILNIITVSETTVAESGNFELTYPKVVSSGTQVFDWPKSPSFNPNYLIKDIKVVHREFEGDLYYFIDPNKKLRKFNYDTIIQKFVEGNTDLCAFGWTEANYDGTTLRDGTPIPQVTDNFTWGLMTTPAWCYYNNDPANNVIYGKLYNWYAVSHPLFAPQGYKVPTEQDWDSLINCLGGPLVAGGKLKSVSNLWNAPNTGATNESLFNALPGGYRTGAGSSNINGTAIFWSSSSSSVNSAQRYYLYDNTSQIFKGPLSKTTGASVRLIKV